MDELISRRWLMECVEEGWIEFDTEKDTNKFIHLVRDTAPSVQPKQVIPHRNHKNLLAYWCECGCYLGIKGETNYCPDCGGKVNWNGRTD